MVRTVISVSSIEQHPSAQEASSKKPPFVRNAVDKSQHKPYKLSQAFRLAGEGIAYTFSHERNMKIHGIVAIFALILGFIVQLPPTDFAIIILCIMGVFTAECFNTALESVVDLVCPNYNDLAKHAKDVAAGAVLICAISAVVIACLLYIPAFLKLIS